MKKLSLSRPAPASGWLLLLLASGSMPVCWSQIQGSGDFAAGTGQLFFPNDYSFTLTSGIASGLTAAMVLDEAVTSDAFQDTMQSRVGTPLGLSIGGADYSVSFGLSDNLGNTFGQVTANDPYIYWTMPASASIGTLVTIKSGTYLFAAPTLNGASPNPQLNSLSFSGNLFLVNASGGRISANVSAVPEPGEIAVWAGAGLVGFAAGRTLMKWGVRAAPRRAA